MFKVYELKSMFKIWLIEDKIFLYVITQNLFIFRSYLIPYTNYCQIQQKIFTQCTYA